VLWSTEQEPGGRLAEFTPFSMTVFPDGLDGAVTTSASLSVRAGLKVRGSSSADYPKRPWRVETWSPLDDDDEGIELLGMPKESDWVLNAPLDFDRALMRNSLAFAMSNAIGRYAPRTRFVEVFVVGSAGLLRRPSYMGVYEATELIKRDRNRVDIAKLRPTDLDGDAVTGGYLFKEDRTGPGEFGFSAGSAEGRFYFQQPFVYDKPDESEIAPEQRSYLSTYLDDVGRALAAPDRVDPRSGRSVEELVDVGSFIDHHILNVFTLNPDAFRLSGYYHKDRGGPLVAGPVWDFDRTMGCSSDGRCIDPTSWSATDLGFDATLVFVHGFYGPFFDDPAFAERYWARMGELLAGPLSTDAITALIDDNVAILGDAPARNFERWSDYPPAGSFQEEVDRLKSWIAARHDWMEGCLVLPDPRTCCTPGIRPCTP
jgi:hypothetical protein